MTDSIPTSYPAPFPVDSPLLTLTHPTATIWQIELHHGAENRLTTALLQSAFGPALNAVEHAWLDAKQTGTGEGALVIVGNLTQDKFFCNGLDFAALREEGFFPKVFDPFIKRLLTFPIPTVCAIHGHAFAGGFVLALACDFRVMTTGKAWGSMNEVLFGFPLPPAVTVLLRTKITDAATLRKVALQGHRFTPTELLGARLVDRLAEGGSKGVLSAALRLGDEVKGCAKGGVFGLIKEELYRDYVLTCDEGRELSREIRAKL